MAKEERLSEIYLERDKQKEKIDVGNLMWMNSEERKNFFDGSSFSKLTELIDDLYYYDPIVYSNWEEGIWKKPLLQKEMIDSALEKFKSGDDKISMDKWRVFNRNLNEYDENEEKLLIIFLLNNKPDFKPTLDRDGENR